MKVNEIIYPLFLECCNYCDNDSSVELFTNLSCGIPPKCTFIVDNKLYYSNSGDKYYDMNTNNDSRQIYNDMMDIFKDVTCTTNYDNYDNDEEYNLNIINWADIRKKSIKDYYYQKYVLSMKDEYGLTIRQCRILYNIIILSLNFKSLTSDDILFQDNQIVKIKGIVFGNGSFNINYSIY